MRLSWTEFAASLLVCALAATSVTASRASEDNSLGVYFDGSRFETTCFEPEAGTVFPVYFVLENCTLSSIGGFEFSWRLAPEPSAAPFVMGVELPSHALNIGTQENLIVGLGEPLVTRDPTVLATFQMMFTVAPPRQPYLFQVGPATPASVTARAAFNDGDDPTQIFEMNYSDTYLPNEHGSDGFSEPGIGGFFCALDDEAASWGSIKARFER